MFTTIVTGTTKDGKKIKRQQFKWSEIKNTNFGNTVLRCIGNDRLSG